MAAVTEGFEENFFLPQRVQFRELRLVSQAKLFHLARCEVERLLWDLFFRQFLKKTIEFQLLIQRDQFVIIRLSYAHFFKVKFYRHETVNRCQTFAQDRELRVFLDFFAQRGLRDFVGPCQKILYRIELLEQSDSGLFSDARNPGDIVRAVAHQSFEVDELCRCQTVVLDHLVIIEQSELRDSFFGDENLCLVGRQLQRVLVSGNDQRLDICLFGKPRRRSDNIVGFVAFQFQRFDAHSGQHFLEQRHLHDKLRRHRLAVCLIRVIFQMAKGRCF